MTDKNTKRAEAKRAMRLDRKNRGLVKCEAYIKPADKPKLSEFVKSIGGEYSPKEEK